MKVIGQISCLIWGKHQGEGFDPENKIIIILGKARLSIKLCLMEDSEKFRYLVSKNLKLEKHGLVARFMLQQ
jgi:hypothetical protein